MKALSMPDDHSSIESFKILLLDIPSFAPVVIVTSVSGLSVRPKNGEYASAMAFFSRGRPCTMISFHFACYAYQFRAN